MHFFSMHSLALANGGSSFSKGVIQSGNVVPNMENRSTEVAIEEEFLQIDLYQDSAVVEVRYQMRNTGKTAVEQGFFFPIEHYGGFLYYHILANGKELTWKYVEGIKEDREDRGAEDDRRMEKPAFKGWKESKIPFKAGQKQEIVIRYQAKYEESGHSANGSNHGPALFYYSFSPAATWKDPIGKGHVVINVLHPRPEDVSIKTPERRFTKISETRYEWKFHDLKPTLADDMSIEVHPSYSSGYEEHHKYIASDDRYYLLHSRYTAKASSTLRGYKVENLVQFYRDENSRPWVEGAPGDGIGEHLTLDVEHPLPLDSIIIMPGYDKSGKPQLWWANNRVAKMKITLNGEHTFSVDIPDVRSSYPIIVKDYDKPVKQIYMEIAGVHSGTKYQNTCISSIQLKAKLTERPRNVGGR